jgi:hypothetical protein
MRIRSIVSLSSMLILVAAAPSFAIQPRLRHVLPHGGQRGQEVKLVLQGTNLEDAAELLLYDRGLEIVSLTVPEAENRKGREVDITARIAADCPLGAQRMRLRTATGLSELVTFYVGTLPIVEEKEPNTDFSSPQAIAFENTVHGRITTEDVDYFAIDAKKGERINIEVVGLRLGTSRGGNANYFDPYVAVLNENRFELAASDDVALDWNDPILSFIPPEDGRYFIQLRDVAYGGDNDAYYLMHVGRFPRPTGIFPLGGKPGETLTVHFAGDPGKELEKQFTVPSDASQLAHIEASDELGTAPTTHPFRVSPLENAFEQEPNNSVDAASAAPAPGAWNGRLSEPGDVDFYKFAAKKGQDYEINVYARRLRSPADTVLVIRDAKGKRLADNDDSGQPDSYLRFKAPQDGDYVAEIRDHLAAGGAAHSYRVEVTPVVPTVSATTNEVRRYVLPTIVIPRGGAYGVQMNVTKRDVGGAIAMMAENLPAGVSLECPEEWNNEGAMPVILRAECDAPLAASWATINLDCGDPKKPESLVHGIASQKILMVRGQNNDRVWEEEQLRIPVAVTEAAPFRVRLVQPHVPLIQGGALPLKVVVQRDEGFNDSIRVVLLQAPPGISTSTATEIPADKDEIEIPLNANGKAPTKSWPIAVRAISRRAPPQGARNGGNRGRGQGGPSWEVCSNWVSVTVEPAYFNLDFPQVAMEQGNETPYVVKVKKLRDLPAEAKVELVGLPANAAAQPLSLSDDGSELAFTVTAAADTPVGQVKNVLCQIKIPVNGELISFSLGNGKLRIDPTKVVAKTEKPAEKPAPKPEPAKALSRLEQLRQEQAAREAAAESK